MRLKRREILNYVFVGCVTIFYSFSWLKPSLDFLMIYGILFGTFAIFLDVPYMRRELLFLVVVSSLVAIAYTGTNDSRLPVLAIALFAGRNLETQKVVRLMFYIKIFCLSVTALFDGFSHKNTISLECMILLLLYMCRTGRRPALGKMCGAVAFYLLISFYTGTGAFVVVGGIAILLWTATNTRIEKRVRASLVTIWVAPIYLFLNYFFAACAHEKIVPFVGRYLPTWLNQSVLATADFLDVATNSRLSLVKLSFSRFGVSLLGGNVHGERIQGYFFLDSGLISLLQGGGILITTVFMVLYTVLMFYLVRKEKFCYVIAGIAIILYAVNESLLRSLGTDFLILLMGRAIHYFLYRDADDEKQRGDEHGI